MNNVQLLSLVILAFATSAVSLTISKAGIFESVRHWVADHNEWLGELVSCPYCTSHWVSLLLVSIYRPVVVQSGAWIIDLAVSVFTIVAMAAMISWLVYRSYKGLDSGSEEEVQILREALQKARDKIVEQNETIQSLQLGAKVN